jgi:phenylpropionate dioxygenase-like ring-hydroxylating dioxygenase large terminal subunit
MLTREENELITRAGPGTPMGEVLRRYWIPAALSEELPEPDCPPVRVKLLGEDLVAFRDTAGQVGLLDEYCAHRCASLFLGRNEEHGLRCVFHGWKYDVQGNCVDMPNEPAFRWTESGSRGSAQASGLGAQAEAGSFRDKIRLRAYPVVEVGGIVWTCMGPTDKRPGPPAMEWLRAPDTHRYVSKTIEYCNYVQGIEGGIDTVHSNFLHGGLPPARRGELRTLRQGAAPALEVERTAYGFRYAGIYPRAEEGGEETNYVRMYQFVMPFQQFRAQQAAARTRGGREDSVPQVRGHLWVPMDDETTAVYNWMYACDPDKPFTPEFILQSEISSGRGPDGETLARHRTRANDWLIDREMQRYENYTGIFGVNSQDLAVQESMGPIVDRSREHLGTTDKAIVMMRYLLLAAVKDVEEGLDPPGADPATYRGVRAADVVLPKDARWQEAASDLLVAKR